MTLTGTIATYIITTILLAAFLYGIYHIYCNFFKGESSCCSSNGSCGGCSACHQGKTKN